MCCSFFFCWLRVAFLGCVFLLLCVVVVCRLRFTLVACCVLFVVYVPSFVVYSVSFVGVCHRSLHVVCSSVRSMFGLSCLCLVC